MKIAARRRRVLTAALSTTSVTYLSTTRDRFGFYGSLFSYFLYNTQKNIYVYVQ